MATRRHPTSRLFERSRHAVRVAAALMLAMCMAQGTLAQRPFQVHDPLYRDEAAGKDFFDRYALTGQVAYRPAGVLTGDGTPAVGGDALGLSFRFDYQLASNIDLGVFLDAGAGTSGRSLGISWVALKYYRRVETSDYAIRLAVDPSTDRTSGFPQLDLAFLYASPLSKDVFSEFGLGFRRVRIGFEQIVEVPSETDEGGPPTEVAIRSRALGWEVHATMSYNVLFDPAGSNAFLALLLEAGRYDLVPVNARLAGAAVTEIAEPDRYRGGTAWIRTGVEFARPSYRLVPFVGLPIRQWTLDDGQWPRSRLQLGLGLTLR